MLDLDTVIVGTNQSWRFLGRLLARCSYEYTDKVPTAGTDGLKKIMVNPDFASNYTREDLIILVAHEMLHIVLRNTYGPIGSAEYPEIWNIAEDIVVNAMLDDHYLGNGSTAYGRKTINTSVVTIHKSGIWPTNNSISVSNITINNISDKTVADIYWEIVNQLPPSKLSGACGYQSIDDHSKLGKGRGDGDGEQDGEGGGSGSGETADNKQSVEDIRREWQMRIMQSAMAEAKMHGTLPGCLGNLVSEITEAKIPWRDRLKNALMGSLITDTSFSRRNKRSCALGVPMPGYVRDGLDVVVHLDTSGSTASDLADFLSEIKGICSIVPGSNVTVIQCDSTIQSVDDISSDFDEFEAKGFGGTSHRPVVDYINEMDRTPKVFVSFTDGFSDIEYCYPDLKGGIYKIICMPEKGHADIDSLSQYGEVLLID